MKTLLEIKKEVPANITDDNLKLALSLIDLTTLSSLDHQDKVVNFTSKVNEFPEKFKNYPNVAAICVYPFMVEHVRNTLNADNVEIASVAGGFPDSQTFLSIKMAEIEMALAKGADEIDIVIPVGEFLNGNHEELFLQVNLIKNLMGDNHLKVIIEAGALETEENIYKASYLSMEAGADFIKTSTGKMPIGATPEAAYTMCKAIKDFYKKTGEKIGFKPAGGVQSPEDAVLYILIVKEILGEEWLNPSLFRIGASSLANNLLSALEKKNVTYF